MNGLDQIIREIEEEARASASALTAKAKQEAEGIRREAATRGEEERARLQEETAAACRRLEERGVSAAALKKRRILLEEKQQILGEVLEHARAAAVSMQEEPYFDFLLRMAARYAQPGEGEVLFNERDLERLPAGYGLRLAAVAAEKGGRLAVSRQTRAIDGGFVLLYGGVEENCSFTALFDANREGFLDTAKAILFGEGC